MTNENPDDILDFALTEISKHDGFVKSKQFFGVLLTRIAEHEVTPVIDKLFKDGYIDKVVNSEINPHPLTPPYHCRISFEGRFFLERGGYKSLKSDQSINRFKTRAISAANAANALAIIIIASISAWLTYRSLQQEDKNEQSIKAITTRLDSFVLSLNSRKCLSAI